MSEFIGLAVLFGSAFGTAIGGVVAFALLLSSEKYWRQYTLPLILGTMLFGMTAGTLLSNRNVSLAGQDLSEVATTGSGASTWLLRLCSFGVVAICCARIGGTLFQAEKKISAGNMLLAAFLCFFVSNSLSNAILGTHPAFVHGIYYAAFIFIAAYLGRHFPVDSVLTVARNGLLTFMLLSLAIAIVKPDLAIQRNYAGFVPGLSIRFWGLGSNPNSIGPLAAVLILITLLSPFRQRLLTWGTLAIAALVLLLTQSKTAWMALAMAMGIMATHRVMAKANSPDQKFDRALVIGIALCTFGVLGTITLYSIDLNRLIDRILATDTGAQITTLTGRTQIWQVAISAWQANPLFGYGVTMWDPLHRYQIGMPFAFSAHNQWLQSLGGAGTFGLAGLLIYMVVALRFAWRAASSTGGISLALAVFLIFRCITETPLETDTLFNGDTLVHLLTFIILLAFGAPPSPPRKEAT